MAAAAAAAADASCKAPADGAQVPRLFATPGCPHVFKCLAFLAGVRAQCDPATTRVVDGVVDGVEVVVRRLGDDRPVSTNLKRRKNR